MNHQPGQSYRISFRAKWLAGSPQFRFELYYNRLARTVILEQPTLSGTPGRQNSVYRETLGPMISDVTHYQTHVVKGEGRSPTPLQRIGGFILCGTQRLNPVLAGTQTERQSTTY